MPLPYENTTAGEKALGEIQKVLRAFGCTSFGHMTDDADGTLLIQFVYKGKRVSVKASMKGYAVAWMKEHPLKIFGTDRANGADVAKKRAHEVKAYDIASVAVYSILRDWIKGQVMAVETGILSFEGAFLGQMLLANGKTVLEHVEKTGMLVALNAPDR